MSMEKLRTHHGICTSVAKSDVENATVMVTVIGAYLCGLRLQKRRRDSAGEWVEAHDLPTDFSSDRFRAAL